MVLSRTIPGQFQDKSSSMPFASIQWLASQSAVTIYSPPS